MSANFWTGCWKGRAPVGDAHSRARKIISPSGGIVRGKFPSRKNGRMIYHEGLLELDAIYLFESSPHIVRYREQPTTLHYPDGQRTRRYTPDFELVLDSGEIVLIEVKPERSFQKEQIRHKLNCVSEHLHRSEIAFTILTTPLLRQEPRLSNLRWLYHQAPRIAPTQHAMQAAINRHREKFPLPLKTAKATLGENGVDVFSLLFSGLLQCPLEMPITLHTPIKLTTEADNGWFFISPKHGF